MGQASTHTTYGITIPVRPAPAEDVPGAFAGWQLADVTSREVDEIREGARRRRSLTTAQAFGYGLIQAQETAAPPGRPPLRAAVQRLVTSLA
jgi:hypothetical protein